jgi:beta-N-acetylhexosaminidase
MTLQNKINSLSLKEMLSQMFILGFSGTESNNINKNIINAVKSGLGGVILFADNINSHNQTKKLIDFLQNNASIPMFISIDQEGGLVERTINIKNRIDYLTPAALAQTDSIQDIKRHTQIMSDELNYMGINMNFAPVLDVNSNKLNPVIGIRSFGNNPEEVIKYALPVIKTFQENHIIPVGKHFPGHGEAGIDSHIDMPSINLNSDDLNLNHIQPFNECINNGLDALMIAHVNYTSFNKDSDTPASLSKEVITDYLINKLNFNGLIISDDMVMGGITEHYSKLDACIKAINAGVDILIYRNSNEDTIQLIDQLEKAVISGEISKERIIKSAAKIIQYKEKYKLLDKKTSEQDFNTEKYNKELDRISLKSVIVEKKGKALLLSKNKKTLIIAPDKSQIFNYSKDKGTLGEFLGISSEILYSLNPTREEIEIISNKANNFDTAIFISYNSLINKGQIDLFNSINIPLIVIIAGSPYDKEIFSKADSIVKTACYNTRSLKSASIVIYELNNINSK